MRAATIGSKWLRVVGGAVIALGAGLSSVVASGSPASAEATVVQVPFRLSSSAQTDIAACIGERVTVTSGSFNVVRNITDTRFVFHRNVLDGAVAGVVTGTAYVATGHLQLISLAPPSSAQVFTFEVTLSLHSSEGLAFSAHGLEHVTVTPDGSLTSSVDSFVIRCGV